MGWIMGQTITDTLIGYLTHGKMSFQFNQSDFVLLMYSNLHMLYTF